MAADSYLLDSNILIRWVQHGDPGSPVVVTALDRLMLSDADLCYTTQNLGEFWNALTRPANRNGYGLSPVEAARGAVSVVSRRRLLPPRVAVYQQWRRLLVDFRVSVVQVHDARLVAVMLI